MLLSYPYKLFAGKKIYRYIKEGKLNKDMSQGMYIYFNSKMVVAEQFWAYGFLAYIAEMGGFVGLFLGYSVLQIIGFLSSGRELLWVTRVGWSVGQSVGLSVCRKNLSCGILELLMAEDRELKTYS